MKDRAPKWFFVVSMALLVFLSGVLVGVFKKPPHGVLRSAKNTMEAWVGVREAGEGSAQHGPFRAVSADVLTDPVLLQGGVGLFTGHCPTGCIAVKYGRDGQVEQAWPYYPDSLENAALLVDWPYEHPLGSSFVDYAKVESVQTYPNGDLLVGFYFIYSFPFGGGVARIAPDGSVVWYRRDYSHHPLHMLSSGDGAAVVPSARLRDSATSQCNASFADYVHVIDGSGKLQVEIDVLDAIENSPWQGALRTTSDRCDPLHLNFVHEVGEEAATHSEPLAETGDFVLSFRHISAFAIMDRGTHRIKRLVRGTFAYQHGVSHVRGPNYVLFDNHGGANRRESRILLVDLATGHETTVFPNDSTPERYRGLFSDVRGHISVSADRRRVIATWYYKDRSPALELASCPHDIALEVRLSDGKVLSEFCTRNMAGYASAWGANLSLSDRSTGKSPD